MARYTCKTCSKPFTSYNPTPRFCSLGCRARAQSPIADPETVARRYEAGETAEEIAASLGVSLKPVWTALRRLDVQTRKAAKRNQRGQRNHSWRGGMTRTGCGYVLVLNPDHPRANKRGYVAEHILVAETFYGPIPKTHEVHHKNEVKHDNRPENLQVLPRGEHRRLHNLLREERKREAHSD